MTSHSMNPQQKAHFLQYFRKFIYGQSLGYQVYSAFHSIPNIHKKITQTDMLQLRKHSNLTPKEQMQINARRYVYAFKLAKQSNNPQLVFKTPDYLIELYGFVLNTGAFLVTIQLIGNQEQVLKWKNLVLNGKVIGGYGQTQLGHGSNVQNLQTQAVFDQQKGTFILNTPKNTATKFWPGCFGLFSTHCVLQAKTTVKGKYIGVQTFILPMRDQYLNLYNGLQAGDIGPKIGFIKVDNGYLKINNFQIPRQNLLSRYIQVDAKGNVYGIQNKQAIKYGYGSMLNLRIRLVVGFALGYMFGPGIVSYQICQKTNQINQPLIKKKLLQTTCTGIGYVLSNIYVLKIFKNFLSALQQKDYNKADKHLISCHIMSSTFKALSSWKGQQILRDLITLNQFGPFQTTMLPRYLADCIPSVTYEGDNTVLLQQTAKFILMKQKQDQLTRPNLQVNMNDLAQILSVFKFVCSSQIRNLKDLIQKAVESGKDFKVVWNQLYQNQIIDVSKIWGRMTLLFTCMETLKTIPQYKQFFQKIIKVFASTLVQQTKQLKFYGFRFSQSTAWKQITPDEIQVMRNFNRPVRREYQPLYYEKRGNKEVSDWIYARL